MAVKPHNGVFKTGDTVVYQGTLRRAYGYKLLKEIYISEIDGYRFVAQGGETDDDGTWNAYRGDFGLLSSESIKESYKSMWTEGEAFQKGDILVGKDKSTDKTMLFVYIEDGHIERLTPRSDMGAAQEFGYSTLADYAGSFGPLKVHTTEGYVGNGVKKFSEL